MPFADIDCFIAGIVQQFRKGNQLMAQGGMIAIVDDAMSMGVLASEETTTTRRTKRDGHKEIPKQGALFCYAVDVGSFCEGMAHAPKSVPTQVVNENKYDIGTGR